MFAVALCSPRADSIHRNLFPKHCFTEAHRPDDPHSSPTSSDIEMTHLANALAQKHQPFIVLAPRKSQGVNKLLGWLVGIHWSLGVLLTAEFLHRMEYLRVWTNALWTVSNSVYMPTNRNLLKS